MNGFPELTDDLLADVPDSSIPTMLDAFPWGDERAEADVKSLLNEQVTASISQKASRDAKVKLLRDMYELEDPDRDPAFPGAANYMVPLVRGKLDAIAPLLTDALIRDPFISITARNPNAESSRTVFEEYMDMTLDGVEVSRHVRLGSHEVLISSVHISKVGVERTEKTDAMSGQVVQDARVLLDTVAYEDFLVNPATVINLEDAFFVGDRFWEPLWKLKEMQSRGELENVDWLTRAASNPNEQGNDALGISGGALSSARGAEYHELFECWFRWERWTVTDPRSGATREGTMWRAWWSQASQQLLLCEPNPYWHGRAPYTRACTQERIKSVWGHNVADPLQSSQLEVNATTNMRLDAQSFGASPVVLVEENSSTDRFLKKNPFRPGLRIPVRNIAQPEVAQMRLEGANPSTLQDIALIRQFADWATLADQVLAQPITGANPTATEVRDTRFSANLKSKFWLSNLRDGYKQMILMIAQVVLQYQIAPAGEETGRVFFSKNAAQKVIKNSDVRLEDFNIQVNGSEARDARTERAAVWNALMPALLPLIVQAPQPDGTMKRAIDDPQVWEIVKSLLDAYDIQNWEAIIGPKPADPMQIEAIKQKLMAMQGQQTQEGAGLEPAMVTQ